jgi:tol-pal system protein YbgF
MGMRKVLKQILVVSMSLFIVLGLCDHSFGAADTQKILNEIQNQVISLRNEFKLRIQRAEHDRLTVYEHIKTKLEDLITKQRSTDTLYPEFKEKVEELTSLLDTYDAKIAELEQALETMESTMNENLGALETRLAAIKQQGIKSPPAVSQAPEETQPEPSASFDFAPGQLFRAAYRLYMDGDYDTAIVGFQKYLEEYPNTQLAGSAQYWIAESFARLEEYNIAIQEYDSLINKYLRDDKIPDAYYGKGVAMSKLGRIDEAKSLFMYTVDHFPGTVAAKKAENQLKELK